MDEIKLLQVCRVISGIPRGCVNEPCINIFRSGSVEGTDLDELPNFDVEATVMFV